MSKQTSQANIYHRTIKLKPIGKNKLKQEQADKKIQQSSGKSRTPSRLDGCFDNQINPTQEEGKSNTETRVQVRHRKRDENKFNVIEDSKESAFSHRKFVLFQKLLLMLVALIFALEILKTQISMMLHIYREEYEKNLLLVINICTASMACIMLLRYICLNQLEIDQKKYYYVRKSGHILSPVFRFIFRWNSVKYFLLELFILLPHPITSLQGMTVTIFQAYDQIYLQHQINDILTLITLFRVYIVFRSGVNLSIYATPRSSRLCHYNGINQDFLYSVKCLLKQIPLQTIALAFGILLAIFGYGLNLSQGTLLRLNPQLTPTGFERLDNCFWCIFISMPTVGYGDLYPKTILGRIVIFIASISGVIISSLLIVSLSNYLTMQPNQSKSHLTLKRLEHQKQLKKQATKALLQTMKLTGFLAGNKKDNEGQRVKDFFVNLKKKIDQVKLKNSQIKSLVNNDNMMQEMDRLFSVFKQSLEDSFNKQVQLKKSLLALDQWDRRSNKMKTLSFTRNVQKMISRKF